MPVCVRLRMVGSCMGGPTVTLASMTAEWVTTSPITAVEGGIATTLSGSQYELGEVDPQYEAAFPNARERLSCGLIL